MGRIFQWVVEDFVLSVWELKGRLGYMAKTLTFTSLVLRGSEGCRRRGW